jgi:hypothetical protein
VIKNRLSGENLEHTISSECLFLYFLINIKG